MRLAGLVIGSYLFQSLPIDDWLPINSPVLAMLNAEPVGYQSVDVIRFRTSKRLLGKLKSFSQQYGRRVY